MNNKIENLPPIVKGELLGKLSEIEIINMLRDRKASPWAFHYLEDIMDPTSRKTIYLYESDLLDILETKIIALRHI